MKILLLSLKMIQIFECSIILTQLRAMSTKCSLDGNIFLKPVFDLSDVSNILLIYDIFQKPADLSKYQNIAI